MRLNEYTIRREKIRFTSFQIVESRYNPQVSTGIYSEDKYVLDCTNMSTSTRHVACRNDASTSKKLILNMILSSAPDLCENDCM